MVDANSSSFTLQARTVLAPGNLSIAAVFSAGAAKESNTSKVEVRARNEGKSNQSFLFYKLCLSLFCPTFLTFDNVVELKFKSNHCFDRTES